MTDSFVGKVALVTGAATGIGLATAQAFTEAGASVVLADIQEDAVRAAAEQLSAAGRQALAVRCDVSDDGQVASMIERTVSSFGRLDAACRLRYGPGVGSSESSAATVWETAARQKEMRPDGSMTRRLW
jgi:NAD(P)-dependent dehydrogenase (short-subunit alcohol dehydrogenase family)